VTVDTDDEFAEYDIYDPASGLAQYRGRDYRIIGLQGGTPILESPVGERLSLGRTDNHLPLTRQAV